MEPMRGAQEATIEMVRRGWELICITSMPEKFVSARIANFKRLGMPITRTIVAPRPFMAPTAGSNPKAKPVAELAPAYFVDDLADNFIGVPSSVKKVLIHLPVPDSPNVDLLHRADIILPTLASFARQLPLYGSPALPEL